MDGIDNQVLIDVRRGKKRNVKVDGLRCLLLPLNDTRVKVSGGDCVLVGSQVKMVDRVKDVNHLQRYRVEGKWLGKSKVLAKAEFKGNLMAYVDLDFLAGQNVFLTCQPDVLDISGSGACRLLISGGGKRVAVPLSRSQYKLNTEVAPLLKTCLNPLVASPDRVVLGWNIKSLFTYLRHYTGVDFSLAGRVCDLKIMEAYSGKSGLSCPETCQEAFVRMSQLAVSPDWKAACEYYKMVAYPLASKVLPNIESIPLVHSEIKKKLYSHYEIEGQANGRLRCDNSFASSYNPHTFSDQSKSKLNLPTYESMDFVYWDYRHMEVSVLQWLSQDPSLAQIIESGEDLYRGIWTKVTNLECTDSFRNTCKSAFLPIVYGQGPSSVAERLKISEKTAMQLIDRFYKTFPIAFQWIKQQQGNLDASNFARDFFGRRRQFQDQQYRVRNFVVQSTASTICLHKLVKLFEATDENIKLIFHIHDGYGMMVKRAEFPKYVKKLASVLEAEDEYYPGLRLRVACRVGPKLDQLKKFELKEGNG